MENKGQETALVEELQSQGARISSIEVFENPIYESTAVTTDRWRRVREFLAGRLPRDDPVLRPPSQRTVLLKLFEAKWEQAAEERRRYRDEPDFQWLTLPRPSLGDIHRQNSGSIPGPAFAPLSRFNSTKPYTSWSLMQRVPFQPPHTQFNTKAVVQKGARTHPLYDVPPTPRPAASIQHNTNITPVPKPRSGTTIVQNQELGIGSQRLKPPGALPVSVGGAPFTTFEEMSKELRKYPVRKGARKKKGNLDHGKNAEHVVRKTEYPASKVIPHSAHTTDRSEEKEVRFYSRPDSTSSEFKTTNPKTLPPVKTVMHTSRSVENSSSLRSSSSPSASSTSRELDHFNHGVNEIVTLQEAKNQQEKRHFSSVRQPPDGEVAITYESNSVRSRNLGTIAE